MSGFYLLMILLMVVSVIVSSVLQAKFNKYKQIPLRAGLSGKEVAEKMLRENGIYDVKVISTDGFLSDHYNPLDKTVNLSSDVYNGVSIASAAVAAHECGHAVQHATAYQWLMLRSRLVPVVQFSSNLVMWVLLGGVLLIKVFPTLLLIGIAMFALTTIFSLVTLPVEFDASKRALAWLETTTVANAEEFPKAKEALNWAASTYVIAAISSVVTLLYYVSIFMGNSRSRN
jgi:Zn-dependent membrane protease YugP